MKLPIFVLPNVSNQSDTQILDAYGRSFTAIDFSGAIRGITTLRLMVDDENTRSLKPQLTAQRNTAMGDLFCFAYPSGKDTNKRITTGAVIFRESDIESLLSEPKLLELSEAVGIRKILCDSLKRKVEEFKADQTLQKKSLRSHRSLPFGIRGRIIPIKPHSRFTLKHLSHDPGRIRIHHSLLRCLASLSTNVRSSERGTIASKPLLSWK